MHISELLALTARRAGGYLERISDRRVFPSGESCNELLALTEDWPEEGATDEEILRVLDETGSPATVATTGGRYFGFVIGGTLPASLAASWLASAWDQNAGSSVMSPTAAALEQVASRWVLQALDLPRSAGVGFVTGATMANFVALAAARHWLLEREGWDVESQGLFGAPPIQVVVGDEVHVSLLKALALLGLGKDRVTRVPTDGQGRIIASQLPKLERPAIVCLQAGNVNSGAFDPAGEIIQAARASDAWVHVDAAFGLWARACPDFAHLANGIEQADSWATDAHKWLNTPYDSGLAICRDPELIPKAMLVSAAYLMTGDHREPYAFTPEMSRRARGVEIWAVLKSLGRTGLATMIERHCRQARKFADALRNAGHEILNDVVLNQVLVSFGTDQRTQAVIEALQKDGTCWCGGTQWHARRAMRISVSSWATTDEDVELAIAAMLRIAKNVDQQREEM